MYGEVVPLKAFADRVDELRRLVRDLRASQKVFLISPRRYGKSSLIRRALASLERSGALTVSVTVTSFSSYVGFLEGYARALTGLEAKWDRSHAAPFANARTERDVARLADDVFALPARVAQSRRRKVVVALDEFQGVAAFDGGSVEHALRAAVQHQRDVGYVFAGSEPSLMERMLGPRRPFYKAGPVMRLEKIPADEFAAFVESRFAQSRMRPEPGLGAAIVDLAGNLPYDVQRLAHETWDEARARGRRAVTADDLHQALTRLLSEHHMMFEAVWQRLTLPQRAVLRAVVLEEGRELLSADVRVRHRLGGASTVQAALGALVRDDLVARDGARYAVVDSLLREWVARQTF